MLIHSLTKAFSWLSGQNLKVAKKENNINSTPYSLLFVDSSFLTSLTAWVVSLPNCIITPLRYERTSPVVSSWRMKSISVNAQSVWWCSEKIVLLCACYPKYPFMKMWFSTISPDFCKTSGDHYWLCEAIIFHVLSYFHSITADTVYFSHDCTAQIRFRHLFCWTDFV